MLSQDEILKNLYLMSEFFHVFSTSDKTFRECASQLNIDNLDSVICTSLVQNWLNNFCEQKDEHWNNTHNVDYTLGDLSAYDFLKVHVLNGTTYSQKQLIKEIRNGIEHLSSSIADDFSFVYINNNQSGFEAKIELPFFSRSIFAHLDAKNYNSYLVDDRSIQFEDGFESNIDNIVVYRVIRKELHDSINADYYREKCLTDIVNEFADDDKYNKILRTLDNNQIELMREYFQTHSFNSENLYMVLGQVLYDESGFSNDLNFFVNDFLRNIYFFSKHCIFNYDGIYNNPILLNILMSDFACSKNAVLDRYELLDNYFKIAFIKNYYQNRVNGSEEEEHIRNCLCHSRYTKTASNTIIMNDHVNGIRNESNCTYYGVHKIDELYISVVESCFGSKKKK